MSTVTFLIVDDDAGGIKAVCALLQTHFADMKCDTALSAAAAIALSERHDYDVIISDIRMPQMDGFALTRRISQFRPNTPIILVTGYGDHDLAVSALNGGAYAYIQKPIEPGYFVALVRRALHLRHLARDLEQHRATLQRRAEDLEGALQSLQREMAERQAAQLNLHESEERFRVLVEQVKDYAIFMIDVHGRVMTWNMGAEVMKGYRADEIIGQPVSLFYTEADLQRKKPQRLLSVARTAGRVRDEGWRVRKDGNRFWADVIITRLEDDTGRIRGFAKITRDLTEQRRMQQRAEERARDLEAANQKLRELDQLKSAFVATVSHELRTPLTAIKGYSNNLLAGVAGSLPDKAVSYLTRIEHNADRLTRMISGLLDLARIEAGQLTLRVGPVMLSDVVKEVVEGLQSLAREKMIVVTSHSEDLPAIQADRDRVFQILANLIQNAVKFTPQRGRVDISLATSDDGGVEVTVRDTGPGIPADKLDKVFERFYRLPTIGSESGGAGLGLAITKSLVELHGGKIRVESTCGEGSQFVFRLPPMPATPHQEQRFPLRPEPQ
ncbi:hybrid sensor histidine kinase/response regulator [Nitrospira sp. Nam74]